MAAPLPLCRRKSRTIGVVCVVAALFYLLQCISVTQLGKITGKQSRDSVVSNMAVQDGDDEYEIGGGGLRRGHRKSHSDSIDDNDNAHDFDDDGDDGGEGNVPPPQYKDSNNNNDNKYHIDKRKNSYNKETNSAEEEARLKEKSSRVKQLVSHIHGVLASDRHLYQPNQEGKWACISSRFKPKEYLLELSMDQINDDFCDCPDSSDEPGTSACLHSKFYCRTQVPGGPAQLLPSSKVGDGICDCCDGSDEWQGHTVPDFMRIQAGDSQGAVYHAPCEDRCGDILALRHREERVREEGRRLQGEYLKVAKELSASQRELYGTNGILFALSKQCHTHRSGQYTYHVCPFKSVKQNSMDLGGHKSRVSKEEGQWVIEMTGGASTLCPYGTARSSKIYLLCGMKDEVISVAEAEKCLYAFKMSSPAAC